MATLTLDDITAGAAVFIDANCLIYAFDASAHQVACRKLLDRIANGDVQGFASAQVLAEVSHRLMTIEAATLFSRLLSGMANWLRRHPTQLQRLSRHRQAIDELTLLPLTILSVTGPQVSRAADISIQHGLLTNDALIVVAMVEYGLTLLASNDADFDRVPGITRFAPV
jgi:predicted nucleic acid-binding protein